MSERSPVLDITATELAARLDGGEPVVVLDVREPSERAYAQIPIPPPAVDLHIPMSDIPSRRDEIAAAATHRLLVVYCHLGMRSAHTAEWLVRQGIGPIANLDGGIDAWSTAVDSQVRRY